MSDCTELDLTTSTKGIENQFSSLGAFTKLQHLINGRPSYKDKNETDYLYFNDGVWKVDYNSCMKLLKICVFLLVK